VRCPESLEPGFLKLFREGQGRETTLGPAAGPE
jgi:hypothetical protein